MMIDRIARRAAQIQYRFCDRVRYRGAVIVASAPPAAVGFAGLEGHHYCLLVTYRRSGKPVPTPVVFGLEDGRLYLRTDAATAKINRIRNDPRVLVGPCNSRGKPRGPLAAGTARVLPFDHNQAAYAVLKRNYTFAQRLAEWLLDLAPIEIAYVEVTSGTSPQRPAADTRDPAMAPVVASCFSVRARRIQLPR